MKTYLKIKIKSLAAEAGIIRHEERRWRKAPTNTGTPHPLYFGLRQHRVFTVRREARSSQLAYGFMRGRPYKSMEPACRRPPDWANIKKIAARFSDEKTMEGFDAWRKA